VKDDSEKSGKPSRREIEEGRNEQKGKGNPQRILTMVLYLPSKAQEFEYVL